MPVNMDPKRKRKPAATQPNPTKPKPVNQPSKPKDPDTPSEADLAEKEWTHLWEATEVIDMDRW